MSRKIEELAIASNIAGYYIVALVANTLKHLLVHQRTVSGHRWQRFVLPVSARAFPSVLRSGQS